MSQVICGCWAASGKEGAGACGTGMPGLAAGGSSAAFFSAASSATPPSGSVTVTDVVTEPAGATGAAGSAGTAGVGSATWGSAGFLPHVHPARIINEVRINNVFFIFVSDYW
jgi:hypothetical protein